MRLAKLKTKIGIKKLNLENRFRSLIENLTDVITVLAPDGTIIYESPSLENVLGYKPEEIIGKNAFEFIHPDDFEKVITYFKEFLQKNKPSQPLQYRIRHKNNSWRLVESVGKTFDDPQDGLAAIISTRDITEKQAAQASLRLSEERFQFASLATGNALWDRDLITDSLWLSDSFYELLGYSRGEVDSRINFWFESLHPDDKEKVISRLRKTIESGERFWSDEYRMRRADGNYVHLSDRGYIVHDAGGKPVRMIGAAINFTDRQQAERQIRGQLSFIKAITNTMAEGVCAYDLEGRVTFINTAAAEMLGWSRDEIIGRNIHQTIHYQKPDTTEHLTDDCPLMSVFKTGNLHGAFEDWFIRKNGTAFRVLCSSVPLMNGGEITGAVQTFHDITRRKEDEKAFIEANQRALREYEKLLKRLTNLAQTAGAARDLLTIFRAILEFAKAALPCTGFFISLYNAEKQIRTPAYAWDSGGKEHDVSTLPPMGMSNSPHSRAVATGKIIIENDFQKAMIGQPVINIGMEEDPNLPQSCLVVPMAFMGRIVGAVEVQNNRVETYTTEYAAAMYMAANLAASAIENVRLLEQERERTEQLRQAQKLESVGRLAGGIAHDFNNMLTAINGYSDLTLRQLKEDDPLRRNIEEIKKAGERSAALTQQLLAFSRKQVLKPKVLEINEVIIETSKLLQRLIGEDVQLSIISKPGVRRVEVDPGQLTQVIVNLAVNARDAMPNGGSLTIETSNVYLDNEYASMHYPTKPGSYVMLAVSDTGVGIDEDTLQHIFEPFFTTKEVGKGTGLGLSTVYGIVKQSNGYIWVDSEVGKGTTFKIYFPRVDELVTTQEKSEKTEDIPGGSETILLVEDEDAVRGLAHEILKSCGYRIIEAQNGNEAIELCQKSNYQIDLLLTDVVMPKMGGRELAEKIAQINPQIRQLFMSGYTDDGIIRQGMSAENVNFIQKPFSLEGLAQKVRDVLDARN